jgi:hypothetical protein
MRVNRIIAFSALTIVLIAAIILAFLPFRFTGSIIAWRPISVYSTLAVTLVVLLFLRPVMPLKSFRFLVLIFAILSFAATAASWIPPFLLAIFIVALGVLSLRPQVSTSGNPL